MLALLAVAVSVEGHRHHPVFTGGLLGVKARVKLLEEYDVAVIELKRVPPLFTSLKGTASLQKRQGDAFELSQGLQTALARRGVSILGIQQHPPKVTFSKCDFVSVTVALPATLGRHSIKLFREN